MEGLATSVAAPNLVVGGVSVTTDSRTEFRNNDGGSITAAAFFAAAPGREVKVRGAGSSEDEILYRAAGDI